MKFYDGIRVLDVWFMIDDDAPGKDFIPEVLHPENMDWDAEREAYLVYDCDELADLIGEWATEKNDGRRWVDFWINFDNPADVVRQVVKGEQIDVAKVTVDMFQDDKVYYTGANGREWEVVPRIEGTEYRYRDPGQGWTAWIEA